MKIMLKTAVAMMALAMGATATPAFATTYSLSGDFSNVSNPNGVWSFSRGATNLTHFAQPANGNPLDSAIGNGYWGVGSDYNSTVMKVTTNGAATGSYTNNDFLVGDVILHSTNPGGAGDVFVNWTAPSAGTIDFNSSLWYAHSPITRLNDVTVLLGNTVLGSTTLSNAVNRSNAFTGLAGSGLSVAAGDVLAFRFTPTAGQNFGSLAGISETINFTAFVGNGVPEPATWALMVSGFGLVGSALRRRRVVAA